MTTIYRAHISTRHFEFEAYGETEKQARAVMSRTLMAHQWQHRLAFGWVDIQEVDCVEVHLGQGYRNGELVTATAKPA